jgi:O-antigen ligase
MLLLAGALLVLVSMVFGGASRENPLRLGAVELSAVPLLLMATNRLADGDWKRYAPAFWVAGAIVAVAVVQLIPLPPQLWMGLPGHAAEAHALDLAGLPHGWRPISLTPVETETSLLALIPPLAMFLGGLCLSWRDLSLLFGLWLSLAILGLILGGFQLVGGDGAGGYLYATTNYGSLVGFFANRNHEASLLLTTTPFAAALAVSSSVEQSRRGILAVSCLVFILLACVGLAAARSRAGIGLAAPMLCAAGLLVWLSPRAIRSFRWILAVGGVVALTVVLLGFLAFRPIIDRFDARYQGELRIEVWPLVEKAADPFLPLGSGIGSFDTVYRASEPLNTVTWTFLNHAHNEYLETWLEAGWLGVIALGIFLYWVGPAIWRAWRRPASGPGRDFARAASIAVLLFLVHSFVDYPLRTTTLSVLFAASCAILARGGSGTKPARSRTEA